MHADSNDHIRGWIRDTIHGHGGDWRERLDLATRHALGTLTFFSVLVLTEQQKLESIWVGTIFLQAVVLTGTIGAAIPASIRTIRDLVLTTFLCWAINLFLQRIGFLAFCVLLPFVTGIITFLIMHSPFLFAKNSMLVVMIVILPLSLHEEVHKWFPLSLLGTCCVGALTALIMQFLPLPKPSLSSTIVTNVLSQIVEDTETLLSGVQSYSKAAGMSPRNKRHAISYIELSVRRLDQASRCLKNHQDAAEMERSIFCRRYRHGSVTRLSDFVAEELVQPNVIRIAVSQRLLGEAVTAYNEPMRQAQVTLGAHLQDDVENLVTAATAAHDVCRLSTEIGYAPRERTLLQTKQQLRSAVDNLRATWNAALPEVETLMFSVEGNMTAPMALLVRRLELLYGVLEHGSKLLTFMESLSSHNTSESSFTLKSLKNYFLNSWSKKNFRLSLKAAVGMGLASLWISIPYLYEKCKPFESWPAITVASVNLASSGSSYVKCVDRLWGTLIGTAVALVVVFFSGNDSFSENYVKIPTLTIFTFVVIFLRDEERPYPCDYAALTLGFVFYGSIKNEFNIPGYVQDRIVLVFLGVCIFILVEVMIFPRSSRSVVQERSLRFFYETNSFLKSTATAMNAMTVYLPSERSTASNCMDCAHSHVQEEEVIDYDSSKWHPDQNLRSSKAEKDASERLAELSDYQSKAMRCIRKAQEEIYPCFEEPKLGFGIPMHRSSWMHLVHDGIECEQQMRLLVKAVKELQQFYMKDLKESHPFRCVNWPPLFAQMIEQAAKQLDDCCTKLTIAFPDGRIRPQRGNLAEAVAASASFRNFDDVQLSILGTWTTGYRWFVELKHSAESEVLHGTETLKMMVTLAFAASTFVEICRTLLSAGLSLEEITREFPRPNRTTVT